MLTTVYPTDIIAITESVHQSPHNVLGMHTVEIQLKDEKKQVQAVRAFMPNVKEITVIDAKDSNKKWAMSQIHQQGFFEVILFDVEKPFDYKLECQDHYGNTWEQEDPYSANYESITDFDRYLFNRAVHYKIYEKMGSHLTEFKGKKGVTFSVWAPNAVRVSVVGDFNQWDGRRDLMQLIPDSGVWTLFKPGLKEGTIYKYEIKDQNGNLHVKADPYAVYSELRPNTASIVYTLEDYQWKDKKYIEKRHDHDLLDRPISIYEVHPGSWRRKGETNEFLTYRDLAEQLVPYVKEMGFTHIELMPIQEHPFDGSWGYQVTGYFAPTSRFGEPKDLQYFIDTCHQNDIAVILDWVPGHFPKDAHGLPYFDGTALYEHSDPRQGEHPEWGTKIFNFGRHEVKNFLISNALYWIDKFHFDGLRVDAVASMLYLNYSKEDGQWVANQYGGIENIDAIEFFKHLNSVVHHFFPGVMMIAEESTAWPGVSRPTYAGGLGFGFKWNMGWMHDTLEYMKRDSIYRRYHHNELTFSFLYAWTENYVLPFSHDEVVHGKGSMINKMPGDYWQKFANLRALYTYMWGHPGKQLLFMGQEFGQFSEWNFEQSLDWHLLDYDFHKGMQKCVKDLNEIYRNEPAMWQQDFVTEGFEGIHLDDYDNSIISFLRKGKEPGDFLIFVVNFTPVPREEYNIGVPQGGFYEEVFNSDAVAYMGSNSGNQGGIEAVKEETLMKPYTLKLVIPPLAGIILKPRK